MGRAPLIEPIPRPPVNAGHLTVFAKGWDARNIGESWAEARHRSLQRIATEERRVFLAFAALTLAVIAAVGYALLT